MTKTFWTKPAAVVAGLTISVGLFLGASSAASAYTLEGSGLDVVTFGDSIGANLSLSDNILSQVDINDSTNTSTSIGPKFRDSYTFYLSQASALSFTLNDSPDTSIKFSGHAWLDGVGKLTAIEHSSTDALFTTGVLGVGTYTITFFGKDLSVGPVSFTGSVLPISAVPLPGSIALFGSALLGLGALARRRGKVAVRSAAVILPIVLAAGVNSAEAATLTVSDGTVTKTTAFNGSLTELSSAVVSAKGTNKSAAGVSGVALGSIITADYDFTLGSSGTLALTITPTLSALPAGTTIKLYDGASLVALTSSSVKSVSLVDVFAGLTAGSGYKLEIVTPKAKSDSITLTGTVSAVPVPGALVLFGSSLVGLAAFGRRKRSKLAA
jgi:hypothetical protein